MYGSNNLNNPDDDDRWWEYFYGGSKGSYVAHRCGCCDTPLSYDEKRLARMSEQDLCYVCLVSVQETLDEMQEPIEAAEPLEEYLKNAPE